MCLIAAVEGVESGILETLFAAVAKFGGDAQKAAVAPAPPIEVAAAASGQVMNHATKFSGEAVRVICEIPSWSLSLDTPNVPSAHIYGPCAPTR